MEYKRISYFQEEFLGNFQARLVKRLQRRGNGLKDFCPKKKKTKEKQRFYKCRRRSVFCASEGKKATSIVWCSNEGDPIVPLSGITHWVDTESKAVLEWSTVKGR